MKNRKQYRMYSNPVLELLATTGPFMTLLYHTGVIALMFHMGFTRNDPGVTSLAICLCLAGGIAFWTLAEYLLHRFVFHYEGKSRAMKAVHYALHGYHHQHPNDANRLFMPPLPATFILSIFLLMFYVIMQDYAFFFLPGFQMGYLVYSFLHYAIHTRRAPRGLQSLWHHHVLHHYRDMQGGYGVSSPFWDWVFGTLPKDHSTK